MDIFLGEPPADIKQWIIDHSSPAGHADTWYKYTNDTEWRTINISGVIDGIPPGSSQPYPTTQIPNVSNVVSLEIGTNVTNIGDFAFFNCENLNNIIIPDSVTSIGTYVFSDCYNLVNIVIRNNVITIGDSALANCNNLESVTFQGKTLAEVQAMANYPWGISDTSVINVA